MVPNVLAVLFLAIASSPLQAQILEKIVEDPRLLEYLYPKHAPTVQSGTFPLKEVDSTLDVVSYEIWMDWQKMVTLPRNQRGDRPFGGRVRMRTTSTRPISYVQLDVGSLKIDSAAINSVRTGVNSSGTGIRIPVEGRPGPGDTLTVDVWYGATISQRGAYGYSGDEIDTAFRLPHGVGFMFTEPLDAEYVYPCHNEPHDKALFTVHLRVPQGYQAVANGELIEEVNDTDSTTVFTWHHNVPMPTYLFSAAASKFRVMQQQFIRSDGRTVPITNYYWDMDHDGETYSAVKSFAKIPRMLEDLEFFFGQYPFDSYGHVVAAPMQIGAMEHQTMVLVNRRWLKGDVETGFAHEVGHHWSGNSVTCGTWADIWLNEGGATWSEALWRLRSEGPDGYRSQMEARRSRYLKTAFVDPPVYDIPIGNLFNEGTTYCKAGWIFHMMYMQEGLRFLQALRKWYAREIPVSKQTLEFQDFLMQEIPDPKVDWNVFFDQWLLKPFHPVVLLNAITSNKPSTDGYYETNLSLSQIQDMFGFDHLYTFNLPIRVHGNGYMQDVTISMTGKTNRLVISTEFPVSEVELDPNRTVLMEDTVMLVTGVHDSHEGSRILVPGTNPHVVGDPLLASVPTGTTVNVVDLEGRRVATARSQDDQVIFDTRSWPSGLVMLVTEGGFGYTSTSIMMVK